MYVTNKIMTIWWNGKLKKKIDIRQQLLQRKQTYKLAKKNLPL